jgi:glucose-1-phosphate cytidylyltransferase
MKAVILAGGYGTRITEESHIKPKPMVEIGGKPIIWHIMKMYSYYGINDFIICLGYKGYLIKEYFSNYFLHMSDLTIDMKNNKIVMHNHIAEPWTVTLVDTGEKTMTGGRLKFIAPYLNKETFCFTYGDGLSDINLGELIEFHKKSGLLATVTSIQQPGRYGSLSIDGNLVIQFQEKPDGDGIWISGGFFVLEPDVLDYIDGVDTVWEDSPLKQLALEGQLGAYRHTGFWQAMDTLREKYILESHWSSGEPPWKKWI